MNEKKKTRRFEKRALDDQPGIRFPWRKKKRRIRYQRWVDDISSAWNQGPDGESPADCSLKTLNRKECESIEGEVRKAVAKLQPDERRFVEMFYFEFNSYRDIARRLNKKIHKLERIHQRAIGKLRLLLASLVKEHFGMDVEKNTDCIICSSPHREKLERLINSKKEEETYSGLIKTFRQKYGIEIKTPQVIIGHRRKHMI